MNGHDWPSPAANLLTIQGEVKDILAAAGVHISNPTGTFISFLETTSDRLPRVSRLQVG